MEAFLQGAGCMVTFGALVCLCIFCTKKWNVPAGISPLFVLYATILWYSVLASVNLLFPAGILWFAAAVLALVWLVRKRGEIRWKELITPSTAFFLVASVAVIAVFAVRQPLFMEWDEFSFWGIAPKVVKSTGQLYTFQPQGLRVTSYVPGLVMLDEAFQFLGTSFAPWKVFAAYDILMFAIFAAGLYTLERRRWNLAVPAALLLCMVPYLMTMYQRDINVSPLYMCSYADIPMGLLFGAPLVVYFLAKEKTPVVLLCAVMGVTVECMSKDMGFALCLIAAALICFDLLFLEKGEVRFARLRGTGAKWCWIVSMVAAPVAAFFGWAAHMGAVTGANRFDIGGEQNMGMVQMVVTGIVELFSPNKSEKFVQVMGNMAQAFYSTKLTMFSVGSQDGTVGRYLNGSGLIVTLVILLVLAVAFVYEDKRGRKAVGWFALWSVLGFAAFYIFTGFTYVYVFKEAEAAALSSYNRYIYPYYIGWFIAALAFLLRSLKRAKPASVGAGFLLALTLGCGWRVTSFVQPQLSVVDYSDGYFAGRKRDIAMVEQAKQFLTSDDRVFYVSQSDDGKNWFIHYYEFYPDVQLDYSFGGGQLSADFEIREGAFSSDYPAEDREAFIGKTLTPEVLCAYLEATGCTALYLDDIDEVFIDTYADLFADGLESEARLYRIVGTGDAMRFEPVEGGGYRD